MAEQVERWLATLTEKYIRRSTHLSTRQLEQVIHEYLDIHNANSKLFFVVQVRTRRTRQDRAILFSNFY